MKSSLEKEYSFVARNGIGVNICNRGLRRTVVTVFKMKTFNLLVGGVTQSACVSPAKPYV